MVDLHTTHLFPIEMRKCTPITLMPFGDVHYEAPLFCSASWDEWKREAKDAENPYFIGMGDYFDLTSFSETRALMNAQLHESTKATLEEMYMMHVKRFQKEIAWMRGRIIGFLEGNHAMHFGDGTTSTMRLCQHFGVRYLGIHSFVRLRINYHGSILPVDIRAHHGKGAAQTPGGSLNAVHKMRDGYLADIYLMGHDHERGTWGGGVIAVDQNMREKFRHQEYCRTGSFLRGYVNDKGSYIAAKCLNPKMLGGVAVKITPKRGGTGKGRVFEYKLQGYEV